MMALLIIKVLICVLSLSIFNSHLRHYKALYHPSLLSFFVCFTFDIIKEAVCKEKDYVIELQNEIMTQDTIINNI